VDRFVERVSDYKATVRRIPEQRLPAAVSGACELRGVQSLVVPADIPEGWLPGVARVLRDRPDSVLSKSDLDSADGVLTGCALAIAQTGTIILDGGAAQGRRALTLLPDYHLCVVFEEQIVGAVPEAISGIFPSVRDYARPLTFISGPSATSDIELSRVEGVHGPRALEVLVVQRPD